MPIPNRARQRIAVCFVSALLSLGFATPGFAVATIFLDIDGQGANATTTVGSTLGVTVKASGVPIGSDSNGLFGFGMRVGYDSARLSASSITIDPQWTGFTGTDNSSGSVGLTANRFGESSGPSGDDIVLGSFDFSVLQEGFASLTLSHFTGIGDNVLFDSTVLDGAGSGIFSNGSITVIPEPGSGVLLFSGLLILALRRRAAA